MVFLALVWGSSFILMKKGLMAFSFVQLAALRVFFAFFILIPFIFKDIKKINRNNIRSLLLVSYAGIFFPAFLFALAQTHISSALSGMLNSSASLFALIVGILFYRSRPLSNQYLGIIIGFIGALALITGGDITSLLGVNAYAIFVLIATFGYGINANEVKFCLKGMNGIQITTLSFLLVGPPAGVILFFTDIQGAIESEWFLQSFLSVLVLSAMGSVLSLFIYNNLIRHTSALFATSVTYLIPIFAILWGVFDGEAINLVQIAGLAIVLIGVYLVNSRKAKELTNA